MNSAIIEGRCTNHAPSSQYLANSCGSALLSTIPLGNLIQTPAIVIAGERALDMLRTILMSARSAA
jgi:hypothetical protein